MNLIESISQMALFQGLPEKQLAEISSIISEEEFGQGSIIFSEGDETRGFYVLLSGRVKIFKLSPDGKEQILHIIEPGEPFAEIALFAGSHYPAHAETLIKSRTILFPRAGFQKLIGNDPDLAMNMLGILTQRLRYFARLVEDLSLKEVPQRLASYIMYLSRNQNHSSSVELNISKGQLASLLGTIPETLSRILSKMAGQGFIDVDGRRIHILKKDALAALASGEKLLS